MPVEPTVVIIAMGEMGAGLAKRLTVRGAHVRTSVQGRSEKSIQRARECSAEVFDDDVSLLDGADIVLSVVPPAAARSLAERLAPTLHAGVHKPIYVDCNAISPETAAEIAAIVLSAGCRFVDCGILGLAPKSDASGPRIYLSGTAAQETAILANFGLDIRVLGTRIGEASALKCCYAALGKGLTAIGAEIILGARRAGVEEALRRELLTYQPELSAWLSRQLPDLYSKAHRWVAEMDEIATFLSDVPGGGMTYHGIAALYDSLAIAMRQRGHPGNDVDVIDEFRIALNLR